jgi:putative nucleotidyltransferase with HDIG domain
MQNFSSRVLELLEKNKVLNRKDLGRAQKTAEETGKAVEDVLIASGVLSREHYLQALSEVSGFPSIDLSKTKIHYATAQVIPQSMAQRFVLLCVKKEEGRLVVAMADPTDTFAIEYVKMRTGFELDPRCAYLADLESAIEHAYSVKVERIDAATPYSGKEKSRHEEERPPGEERPRFVVATSERKRAEDTLKETIIAPTQIKTISLEGFKKGSVVAPAAERKEEQALRVLLKVGTELASTLNLESLIHKLLVVAMELTQAEGASLILLGEDRSHLYFKDALGPRADQIRALRIPYDEHSIVGYSMRNRRTLLVNDVSQDPRHNRDVDRAIDFRTRSLLCVPVLWRGDPLGAIEVVNKKDPGARFDEVDQEYLEVVAAQAAVALYNAWMLDRLTNFYHEVVEILIDTLEASDTVSRRHLVEVARLCTAMGRFKELSAPEMEKLCYAALLHDIGKIKCQDPNDPAHAEIGAQLLAQVKLFQDIAPFVRHHHEHWDGTGYPGGLAGEQIPRLARYLAVAEAWVEGLAQAGPGRAEQVLSEVRRGFGSRFDPGLRAAFEHAVAEEQAVASS